MAIGGNQVLSRGFEAAAAITQFRFVELVTGEDRRVQQVGTLNNPVVGVCQEEISAEDVTRGPRVANVALMGVSVVEAAAAITKGDRVRSDATGKAVALANAAGTVDQVAGIALDDAGGDGDWISVLLTPGVTHNPATT